MFPKDWLPPTPHVGQPVQFFTQPYDDSKPNPQAALVVGVNSQQPGLIDVVVFPSGLLKRGARHWSYPGYRNPKSMTGTELRDQASFGAWDYIPNEPNVKGSKDVAIAIAKRREEMQKAAKERAVRESHVYPSKVTAEE